MDSIHWLLFNDSNIQFSISQEKTEISLIADSITQPGQRYDGTLPLIPLLLVPQQTVQYPRERRTPQVTPVGAGVEADEGLGPLWPPTVGVI
jgi:hypothetical protein